MYKPNNIQIQTTTRCTLACKFCPKSVMAVDDYVMDMDIYRDIVDKCVEFGIRNFELSPCVGDPSCDPHLLERVDYLHSKDIDSVYFYSNLVRFDVQRIAALSKYNKLKIYVSVYGGDRETFMDNTGVDAYNLFCLNIAVLIENYPNMIDELHMRYNGWKRSMNTSIRVGMLTGSLAHHQLIDKSQNVDWIGNLESDSILSQPCSNGRVGACHFALVDNGVLPDGSITLCHWFDMNGIMAIGHVDDLDGAYDRDSLYQQVIAEQEVGLYRSMCKNCQGFQKRCDDDPVI